MARFFRITKPATLRLVCRASLAQHSVHAHPPFWFSTTCMHIHHSVSAQHACTSTVLAQHNMHANPPFWLSTPESALTCMHIHRSGLAHPSLHLHAYARVRMRAWV